MQTKHSSYGIATAHKYRKRLVVCIGAVHGAEGEDITKVSVLTLLTGIGPENGPYLALLVQ